MLKDIEARKTYYKDYHKKHYIPHPRPPTVVDGMLLCKKCNTTKPVTEFYPSKNGRPTSPCKKCRNYYEKVKVKNSRKKSYTDKKMCKTCKRVLGIELFHEIRVKHYVYSHSSCKECNSAKLTMWGNQWRKQFSKEELAAKKREWQKNAILELSDSYISHLVRDSLGVTGVEIPSEVIKAYRTIVQIQRTIK